MSNENSSNSTSQGLVGASTAASTALTARRMVSRLEAELVLELAMYTATCPAALSFSHLMCPPAAEVAQMHTAHDLDGLIALFQEKLWLVRQLTRQSPAAGATRQAPVPPAAGHLGSFTGPSACGSSRGTKPVMPVSAAAVAADFANQTTLWSTTAAIHQLKKGEMQACSGIETRTSPM